MIGKFNQGWWNCFNAFAIEILENDPNSMILENVLEGAGVDSKEIRDVIKFHGVHEFVEHFLINYAHNIDKQLTKTD